MSSAGGIRAGRAFVEIFTDNSPLVRGLKRAQTMIAGWGAGLRSMGAKLFAPLSLAGVTGIAGLAALGTAIGNMGGELNDAAARTGLTAEAVAELGHAAKMSGAEFQDVEGGIRKMQRTISDAGTGSKEARAALAQLGVSADQLAGMTPDEQLAVFADRIAGLQSPADRTAAAMAIFGKSGTKLIPMLSAGAAGLEAMRGEVRGMITNADVAAADELGDSIDALKNMLKAAAFSVGAAFAPAMTQAAKWLGRAAGTAAMWIRDNRALILAAIAGAGALLALGAAVWGVGAVLSLVSAAIGGAIALLTGIGAVLGFIVSPIGLVIAGLVGISVWLLRTTNIGQTALGWLGAAWGTLSGEATTAWGAIVNAVKAGDLQAAFEVGMAFLRVQWVRTTNFLESRWLETRDFVVDVWTIATGQLAQLFVNALSFIQAGWVVTMGALSDAWNMFLIGAADGFRIAMRAMLNSPEMRAVILALKLSGGAGAGALGALGKITGGIDRGLASAGDGLRQKLSANQLERQNDIGRIELNRRAVGGEISAGIDRSREARDKARMEALSAEEKALADAMAKFAGTTAEANKLQADQATGKTPGQVPVTTALRGGAEKAAKTVEAADIRTGEGLKQVLSAFAGGGADQQTAANTAHTNTLLSQTNAKLDDQTDKLDRIERDGGSNVLSLAEVGG